MQNRAIDTIYPYPDNAKKHPDKQVAQIAKSIEEFGFNQPIVVDKQGFIVVGHGRYLAAKMLGRTEVPCIEVDLDEERTKVYRLADNKLNESEWDMGIVIEELRSLSIPMLELTGFDKDLLLEDEEKDNELPTDVPSVAQLGDIWALGPHRVMCGSAELETDMSLLMDGRKADMVLTDPPYNVDYVGKTKDALKIQNDHKTEEDFIRFLTTSFKNLDRNLKQGGVFYIWHADSEGYAFRTACKNVNWRVRQCLIWNKNSMVMGRQDYHWKHEPCLYGWKEGAAHLWNADRTQTTVLNFNRPSRSEEHPRMKPVELLVYQITNNSKGEDIVLDTFLGSGSTLIAAQKTGRICYGMELDPKYMDVIIKRWEEYTGLKATKL